MSALSRRALLHAVGLTGAGIAFNPKVFAGTHAQTSSLPTENPVGHGQLETGENHLAWDLDGVVYEFHPTHHAVTRHGNDARQWHSVGDFRHPIALVPGESTHLYIVEQGNDRVTQIRSDGSRVRTLGEGTGVRSAAVGLDGTVWTASTSKHFVRSYRRDGSVGVTLGTPLQPGNGRAEFNGPRSMALDPSGCLHVVDRGNARVQVFHPRGRWLRSYGSAETLRSPSGIVVGGDHTAYVSDSMQGAILVFGSDGSLRRRIPLTEAPLGLTRTPRGSLYARVHRTSSLPNRT